MQETLSPIQMPNRTYEVGDVVRIVGSSNILDAYRGEQGVVSYTYGNGACCVRFSDNSLAAFWAHALELVGSEQT